MKRKILNGIGIVLFTILMIQIGSILCSPAIALEVTTIPQHNIAENIFMDSIRQYVMHFESVNEYNQYVETYSPRLSFPNLKMVIIDDWLSKKTELRRTDGVDRVYDITEMRYYFADIPKDYSFLDDTISTVETKNLLNVQPVWDLGYYGQGIVVYDIDTGINTAHQDFLGRINFAHSQSFVNTTYGYSANDNTIEDIYGHGTPTAGVALGSGSGNPNYIGMAPQAQLLVGKVSSTREIRSEAIIAALEYALALGNIDVINMSLGGPDLWGMDLDELLVQELTEAGVVVSCAGGNQGEEGYYGLDSPGSSPQAISVAATNMGGYMAAFSSFGPTNEGFAKPDLAAPGVGIMAPIIGGSTTYGPNDGTSFSCPHITGVSATIISALKGLAIPYDAGLVKTALMKSANPGSIEYLLIGAGFPNVGQALNLIQTAPTNGSGFPSIMWAIPEFPIAAFETMPQGFHYEMFVESVSSTPWNDLTPVMSGNITSIATLNTTSWTGPWAKNFFISIDVPDDATLGVYEGYITFATAGGAVTASTHIKVNVVEGKARVFFPWFLNEWRANHFLGQYRYATQDLLAEGIAVNEYAIYNISGEYSEVTPELLAEYDAVWLADVFDYNFDSSWNHLPMLDWRPTLYDEISAIQQFVDNGGGLLIDVLGEQTEFFEGVGYRLVNTNTTVVNDLLDPYGITLDSSVFDFTYPDEATIIKNHAITEGVTFYDHYGTTLSVTGSAELLATYHGEGTAAVFENANGGRIVAITTNFFMDTDGYPNNYNPGKTQNDVFTKNIFHWLVAEEKIIASYTTDSTGATFSITSLEPSAILTASQSIATASGTTTTTATLVDLGGGSYSYRMNFGTEGIYTLEIESADDKYIGEILYDSTPPEISTGGWVNNTKIEDKIDFSVVDATTNIITISAKLNGEDLQIFGSGKVRTFIVFASSLIDGDNILKVVAIDAAENRVDATYVIPTKARKTPVSTLAVILGFLSLASLITLIRRKRR